MRYHDYARLGLASSLFVSAAFVSTAFVFAAAASAQCTPTLAAIEDIEISLIDEAFPYESYVPALSAEEIADLPDLPEYDDETVRKEHAYISTALATELGLDTAVQADWGAPNPQIRVRIANPSSFSNFWKKSGGVLKYRDRESSAVFTVVGILQDEDRRIWVYQQESTSDTASGHYKLFAADTALASGSRVVAVAATADADLNGRLDNVEAHAWPVAVSLSTFTPAGGSATATQYFCEADTDGGELVETAVEVADNRLLVLAPHGGTIETGTSEQALALVAELDTEYSIDANLWNVEGDWSDNQTSARWHITSTNLSEGGYPALEAVKPTTYFGAEPFRFALSFHGFSANTTSTCPGAPSATTFYQLILGGETAPANKCLVALRIREAMNDAVADSGRVAISIRNDDEANIEVADTCGRTVTRTGLDGTAHDNVVNRLAVDGGFQLEQSRSLRDDATLRQAVALGVAEALAEILGNTAPADPCALLP